MRSVIDVSIIEQRVQFDSTGRSGCEWGRGLLGEGRCSAVVADFPAGRFVLGRSS